MFGLLRDARPRLPPIPQSFGRCVAALAGYFDVPLRVGNVSMSQMVLDVEQVFPQFGEMGAARMPERVRVRFRRIDACQCAVPAHQRPYLPAAKGATIAREKQWSRRCAALIYRMYARSAHNTSSTSRNCPPGAAFAAGSTRSPAPFRQIFSLPENPRTETLVRSKSVANRSYRGLHLPAAPS